MMVPICKIERLNINWRCRNTLSMTASLMVVIAKSNSLLSSRSKKSTWSQEIWCRDREIHQNITIALLQIGTKSNATTVQGELFNIIYRMKLNWGSNSFSSQKFRNLDDRHGRVNILAKCRYRASWRIQRSIPSSHYEWIAAQTESSEAYLSF